MDFTPITSSNLNAAAYEDGDLYLKFNNGSVYRYLDVPESVFRDLLAAESCGKFFHAAIRNQFTTVQVKDVPEDVAA